ncbi:MAG: penicillin acylase family protein [Silvanigrellaceae bacterium]
MSVSAEKRPYLMRILGTWGVFLLIAVLLSVRLGPIPPLGAFLSPASGYLNNSPSASKKSAPTLLSVKGLKNAVSISTDLRGVPHISAENDTDLAFGQGFATARDRLWQMELQTAATAGRVSEILGERAFDFDSKQRRLGFSAAADIELEYLKNNDKEQYEILEAYSSGVNAYIGSLTPAEYPIEYKLLGTSPEPWTPLKCVLFHKQMTWILTGNFDDFKFTNVLQKLTVGETENLFPEFYSKGLPILDSSVAQMSSSSLIDSGESAASPMRLDGILQIGDSSFQSKQERRKPSNGSNNWVVDGLHTSHAYPVLANDPHLDLKLPSIWYEIQLTAPGVNVYGVTLPGLPHVIIGFNESASWGITNAGVDVIDWYAMKFDKTKPTPNYFFAQQWKPATIRKEVIRIKGKASRIIEVVQTHLGPIANELELEQKAGGSVAVPFAMKWSGHAPSNEFRVFHSLNRARSVMEMKNALKTYYAPGQNFVMADKTGSIGYVQAGRFPVRSSGFGRYVLDGTSPSTEWREDIGFVHLPQSWSPDRGYLFSANQQPTRDPTPGFASGDWGFTSYLRGTRIGERLAELTSANPATISALMDLQNDVVDLRAKALLPLFSGWVENLIKNKEDRDVLDGLRKWNFQLSAASQEATIWNGWWNNVYDAIWEKTFPKPHFPRPSEDRTMELLGSANLADWPQMPSLPAKSEIPSLVASSFERTLQTLRSFSKRNGVQDQIPAWGKYRGTKIPHLANLPGFGLEHLETGGDGQTVNATTDHHGPSWRMVVTWVDAQPKAWGIYPGGPSGHVGSRYYTNMIDSWLNGKLDELLFVQQGQLKESLTLARTKLEVAP